MKPPAMTAVADARTAFACAVRLAAASRLEPDLLADIPAVPLTARDLLHLGRHDAFRRPFMAAAARKAGWEGIGRADCARLTETPQGRLAMLVASAPPAEIRQAARIVASAVLHKHVLAATGKEERQRLRLALGTLCFQIATREAPTLHAGLALLDPRDGAAAALLDPDAGNASAALEKAGYGVLAAFLLHEASPLARLFALRHGESPGQPLPSEQQVSALVKLLRRRMPEWSAIIG